VVRVVVRYMARPDTKSAKHNDNFFENPVARPVSYGARMNSGIVFRKSSGTYGAYHKTI
jgi:hypothetical protein